MPLSSVSPRAYLRLDGERLLHLLHLLHSLCDLVEADVQVQLLLPKVGPLLVVQRHEVVDEVQVVPVG